MSIAATLTQRLDDAMNPIVVKELRQAVRSRFVSSILLLFLTVQVFTIGIYLIASDSATTRFDAGRDIYMVLHGIVLITCMVFVPLYTAVRLGAERSDTNVDLLFISTISPHAIIWGKLWAALVVAALIYSACLPFLTLTYLLRGIDVPSMLVILAIDAIFIVSAIQVAIFLSCIRIGNVIKVVLGLGFLWMLGTAVIGGAAMTSALIYQGIGSQLGTRDFWIAAGMICLCAVLGWGLLGVLSVAMIMPPSSNRSLVPRLYLTGTWLLTGGVCWTAAVVSGDRDFLRGWCVIVLMTLEVGILVCIGERDRWTYRVARTIPRALPGRLLAFVFYSGQAGGVLWAALLVLATLGAMTMILSGGIGVSTLGWSWFEECLPFLFSLLHAFAYGMTAVLLRWWFYRKGIKPIANITVALALMVLGSIGPMVVGFLMYGERWDLNRYKWMLLGDPFAIFFVDNDPWKWTATTVLTAWAAIMAILSIPWFIQQFREFRRPTKVELQDIVLAPSEAALAPSPSGRGPG